jgi:hypothetical protein
VTEHRTYTIKPLEWRDNGFSGLVADPFGPYTYHICFISGVEWSVTRSNVCGTVGWNKSQDKAAAMAACQAHYETELQAVLQEHPNG